MRLQAKYTLIIVGLIVGVVFLLTSTLLYGFRSTLHEATRASSEALASVLQEQAENRGLQLTQLLAANLVNPLYQYDMEAIHRLLESLRSEQDIAYSFVFDPDGRVIHDGQRDIPSFGARLADVLGRDPALAEQPRTQLAGEVLDVYVPLRLENKPIGGVYLGFSLAAIKRELTGVQARIDQISAESRRSQYVAIGLITAFLIVLGAVTAAAITRHLVRPIRQLARAATRIGRGESRAAITLRRSDELGELAAALQAMQQGLQQTTVSKEFLDRIIDGMKDALLVTTPDGHIKMVNRAACALFGYDAEELVGTPLQRLMKEPQVCTFKTLLQDSQPFLDDHECWLRTHAGDEVPVAVSLSVMHENGGDQGLIFIIQDITERQRNERHLRLAARVFANIAEAIMVTDREGTILQVNPAFSTITGYGRQEAIGNSMYRLLAQQPSGHPPLDLMRSALRDNGHWQGELHFQRPGGEAYPVWLTLSAIHAADNRVQLFAGVFSDLTERKETQDRIYRLAYYDSLTGLPNRLLFQDRLQQAIHQVQRSGRLVALFFLDLDRFKIINDTKGHAVGDQLLKRVAERLSGILRKEDTIARLGGDEFAIINPGIKRADEAAALAREIIQVFSLPYQLDNYQLFTGTSIGISLYPLDAVDAESLLKNADAAMYRAKEQGRNDYQFFTPEFNARVLEHVELETGLRQAIERQELVLHYQPQIELGTGELIGMEALLRWEHPVLGTIPPSKFIPVAEDSGLIVAIGQWVLAQACGQAQAWARQGLPPLRVAVNLSARQFREQGLLRHIEAALQDSGLEPGLLEVEITESLLMEDLDRTIAALMRLNEMGVRISIDDFGTGYSSLSYLKRFPLHTLKIDKTFIRDIIVDHDDAAITRAIITMSHNLGIRVLAEGVETREQHEFLRAGGCDFAQGYHYSRPLPGAQSAEFARTHTPGLWSPPVEAGFVPRLVKPAPHPPR